MTAHADYCHVTIGCIEPGQCTCDNDFLLDAVPIGAPSRNNFPA